MPARERKQVEKFVPAAIAPTKKAPKKSVAKKAAAKATKGKAKKVKVDKPKKANAYIMYCSSVREDVKSKNKDASITDLARIMGAMWKKLSDKDKTAWKKKADAQTAKNAKEFAKKK